MTSAILIFFCLDCVVKKSHSHLRIFLDKSLRQTNVHSFSDGVATFLLICSLFVSFYVRFSYKQQVLLIRKTRIFLIILSAQLNCHKPCLEKQKFGLKQESNLIPKQLFLIQEYSFDNCETFSF